MSPSNQDFTQVSGRPYSTLHNMSNRISRLFERRQDQGSQFSRSQRTSGACDVPIFMSRSSDHLHYPHDEEAAGTRSLSHRDSIEEDEHHAVPASSVYSQSPNFQARNTMEEIEEESRSMSADTTHDLEAGHSTSCPTSEAELVRQKRRKRRRVAESYRSRIAAKKRLGMAFGITTLAAVITCK